MENGVLRKTLFECEYSAAVARSAVTVIPYRCQGCLRAVTQL